MIDFQPYLVAAINMFIGEGDIDRLGDGGKPPVPAELIAAGRASSGRPPAR